MSLESGNLTEKGFESRRASETLIEKVPPSQFVACVTRPVEHRQAIAHLSTTSSPLFASSSVEAV